LLTRIDKEEKLLDAALCPSNRIEQKHSAIVTAATEDNLRPCYRVARFTEIKQEKEESNRQHDWDERVSDGPKAQRCSGVLSRSLMFNPANLGR
jgi:hypothetical protein